MSQLVTDIGFNPTALVGALLLLFATLVLLLQAPRAGRAALLPAVAGGALLSAFLGMGLGARALYEVFSGMSLTGSGGMGTVAAGLAEVRAVVLCGTLGAVLILLLGLALARPAPPAVEKEPAGERIEPPRKEASLRWLLLAATVLALLAAAMAMEDLRLSNAIPPIVSVHPGAPVSASSVGATSSALAGMLIRLVLGALLCAPAALLVAVLSFMRDPRAAPSRGLALWGQGLLAVLLVLALAYLMVSYGMHARFDEAGMIGHF
jgi:hypothetical protein